MEFVKKTAGTERLILIFAGWGSDARLYSGVDFPGWDTAVIMDYSDLSLDTPPLTDYSTVYVYAWSMGVWAASTVRLPFSPDAAFAINGTERPRNDRNGIPEKIYDGTLNTLDERNLRKFRQRMAGDRATASQLEELLPAPDIAKLKEELEFIRRTPTGENMKWTRAYIGEADRIFPPEAQRAFWEDAGKEIHNMESPHYVDFKKIISATLHNPEKVGRRFGKALSTYDRHATAQREIARHLAKLTEALHAGSGGKVLEIGSGSGLFTRLWTPILKATEADFVDLYPTPHYDAAPEERHHIADGEEWMNVRARESQECYDAIVSASTMQWFAAPRVFFRNAAKLLRDKGVLSVSGFTKGNLRELDVLRPSPMLYHTAEELRDMASQWLDGVRVEEKEFPLRFGTARELLLHLKHTGVGGSASTGAQGSELSRKLKSTPEGDYQLTYRAVFITGKKSGKKS